MKKILIVEDDPVVQKMYGALQKAGYETELAVDGQMGLEHLYEFRPRWRPVRSDAAEDGCRN